MQIERHVYGNGKNEKVDYGFNRAKPERHDIEIKAFAWFQAMPEGVHRAAGNQVCDLGSYEPGDRQTDRDPSHISIKGFDREKMPIEAQNGHFESKDESEVEGVGYEQALILGLAIIVMIFESELIPRDNARFV